MLRQLFRNKNSLGSTSLHFKYSGSRLSPFPSAHARTMSTEPSVPNKLYTLVLVQQGDRLLLGRKKRGVGEGYYNGFGGKVEKGETIFEGAARELEEEAGIRALDLEHCCVHTFHWRDRPEAWEVHVYRCTRFEGTPVETDEMAPVWFKESELPFDNMWADDRYWYPHFVKGKKLIGTFHFTTTTNPEMLSHKVEVSEAPVSQDPGAVGPNPPLNEEALRKIYANSSSKLAA